MLRAGFFHAREGIAHELPTAAALELDARVH